MTVKLLHSIREEIAGALRSLRYDANRGASRGESRAPTQIIYPEYDAYSRSPRRFLSAAGIAALAVSGVAATYFLLAMGLRGVIVDPSMNEAPANPFPVVTNSEGRDVVKAPPTNGSGGAPQPSPDPGATGPATEGHTTKPKPTKPKPTKHTSAPPATPSSPAAAPSGGHSVPPPGNPSPPDGSVIGASPLGGLPLGGLPLGGLPLGGPPLGGPPLGGLPLNPLGTGVNRFDPGGGGFVVPGPPASASLGLSTSPGIAA